MQVFTVLHHISDIFSSQRPTAWSQEQGPCKGKAELDCTVHHWEISHPSSSSLPSSCAIYALISCWQERLQAMEETAWLSSEVLRASCCWHGPLTVESVQRLQPCCSIPVAGLGLLPCLLSVCARLLGSLLRCPCHRMAWCLLTGVGSQLNEGTDEHCEWI